MRFTGLAADLTGEQCAVGQGIWAQAVGFVARHGFSCLKLLLRAILCFNTADQGLQQVVTRVVNCVCGVAKHEVAQVLLLTQRKGIQSALSGLLPLKMPRMHARSQQAGNKFIARPEPFISWQQNI